MAGLFRPKKPDAQLEAQLLKTPSGHNMPGGGKPDTPLGPQSGDEGMSDYR
ncbi:hypothetical protein ACFQ7A_08615 [Streptomyces sp. NPDC056528]|uniref:hypothetical protein n=1 Tax=Streptomyces sp. NPDC056528 TaxID=3345854 RepID=UPI003694956E